MSTKRATRLPPRRAASSAGAFPPSKEKEARASYLALRSALLKSAKLKTQNVSTKVGDLVTTREIFVPDKKAARDFDPPSEEDFRNPRLVGRLTIQVVPAK